MEKMTRRRALGFAGSAGVSIFAARRGLPRALAAVSAENAAAATAALTPTMTEGPYWVDELLRRSDVRANTSSATRNAGAAQEGIPLSLEINVRDADNGDRAVNGAHVDIWHANAYGLYSGESSQQVGGGTSTSSTKGQNFLRGYQVTGVDPRGRPGHLQDRLARLVLGAGDPHSRARAHLRHARQCRDELHDADLLRRRGEQRRSERRGALQHAHADRGPDDGRERQRAHE